MTSGNTSSPHEEQVRQSEPDPRRWRALIVLSLIQFLMVIDVTVVNVALPRIQEDLGFTPPGLAWVVNAYVVMAGGLLLLGGRLADIFGRRRVFLLGVGIFSVASAVCGAAIAPAMLISGRLVQGVGEALAAPASLGLIALLFPDIRERIKAIGIWGGVSGLAGVSGVVISGVVTDLASWRWLFYINVPIALFALFVVPRLVSESRMIAERRRMDVGGAVTVTGGLLAIVYGLLQAASHPWGSWQVLLPLVGGLFLLALMVLIETRVSEPLIPMRFFANRTRVTANSVGLFFLAAFISYFFLMTLFMQQVLGYSPMQGGLAYLPFGLAMGIGVGLATGLMPKLGVKPMLVVGFIGAAVGLLLSSGIEVGTGYASGVMPGMIVFGLFSGIAIPGIANAALHQVTGQDASLASGVQQAVQQVGGAIGLAFLVTLALRYATAQISDGAVADIATTEGYVLSLRIAAVVLVVSGVLVLVLLDRVAGEPRSALTEMDLDPQAAAAVAGADGAESGSTPEDGAAEPVAR
jgi:EmrB/QacA subfamily drug resistance transporter